MLIERIQPRRVHSRVPSAPEVPGPRPTENAARSLASMIAAAASPRRTRWPASAPVVIRARAPRLSGRLVATHMTRAPGGAVATPSIPGSPSGPFDASVFEQLDARGLHRAAGSVPHAARAALWLVLLRRWSYDDACSVMGVGREDLADLLRYRHTLVSAVLSRKGKGSRRRGAGA